MTANPYTITIPAHDTVSIDCVARASFLQRATIRVSGEANPNVFIGQGEVVQMKLDPSGAVSLDLDDEPIPRALTAILDFSRDGGRTYTLARLRASVAEGRFGTTW